jgi:hypothetical protein
LAALTLDGVRGVLEAQLYPCFFINPFVHPTN